MTRLLVVAGLSAVLGLAVGFAAFSAPPPLPPPECPPPARCPAPVPCPSEPLPARLVAQPAPAPVPPAAADGAALQARVADLESKLAAEKAKTQGTPRPFPQSGVDPKYTSQPLLDTFRRAFKEAGFPGDVSAIDCNEYPCIVFGSGFGASGDSAKLKATSAFQPYSEGGWMTFGFNTRAADPKDRFFGMAVVPPGERLDDDQNKRLKFRMDQMWDASRPKEK